MKQLTCEMCGSTDLIKQDGVFVCQSCGCKYSVEEAKKMMIEGTVEVKGSVKVDDSEKESIYKDIAINAYNAGNTKEAYQYFLKVLEINPADYHSLFYKGMCQGWEMTSEKERVGEAVAAYHLAVKHIPEEKVPETKETFISYLAALMATWLENAKNWYPDTFDLLPTDLDGNRISDERRYAEIETGKRAVEYIDSYMEDVINSNSATLIETVGEVYCTACEIACDFFGQILPYIDDDGDYRTHIIREGLSAQEKGPYISSYENMIFEVRKYNPEFKKSDLCNGKIEILSPEKANYEKEQHRWFGDLNKQLCLEADEKIDKRLSEYNETVIQQKKKEAREKYWSEHASEKQQLESSLKSIEAELKILKEKDDLFVARIEEIKKELSQLFPAEKQLADLRKRQSDLATEKSKLGIFSWNKKKSLQLEIDLLQAQFDDIAMVYNRQRQTIQDDVSSKIAAVEVERKPYLDNIVALENEKQNIMAELTKDR